MLLCSSTGVALWSSLTALYVIGPVSYGIFVKNESIYVSVNNVINISFGHCIFSVTLLTGINALKIFEIII
jgi:hypothetical protein